MIKAQRENYLTVFRADKRDIRALARWLQVCLTDREKGQSSNASALWQGWLDETFIGFSGTDKILLHSGHRVALSSEFVPGERSSGRIRSAWRCLRKVFKGKGLSDSSNEALATYKRFFPDFQVPERERYLAEMTPSQYLHACETFALLDAEVGDLKVRSVFEIGAGAGIHLALLALRSHGGLKDILICDLPHSIFAGYLFLRTALPEYVIRLPDELDASMNGQAGSIQFVTPNQLPRLEPARFDFALNTQSFQEMDLKTVNDYLREVARLLKPEGLLLSKNSRISRHIKGNALDQYDFSGFSQKVAEVSTPFTNELNPFDCVLTCFRN